MHSGISIILILTSMLISQRNISRQIVSTCVYNKDETVYHFSVNWINFERICCVKGHLPTCVRLGHPQRDAVPLPLWPKRLRAGVPPSATDTLSKPLSLERGFQKEIYNEYAHEDINNLMVNTLYRSALIGIIQGKLIKLRTFRKEIFHNYPTEIKSKFREITVVFL